MKRYRSWMLAVMAAGVALPASLSGQSVRSLVREGNREYENQKYSDAEVSYRKALEKDQQLVPGQFNLGNSLYKQDKADEAIRAYENAAMNAGNKETKAKAYFNMGDAFMKGQRYQEAVKSYIESLKLDPGDQDTKYNLSYALAKLREQQQQQQQQPQNKNDKNKDNKQDQQKNQKNQDQQNTDQQQQQNPQQKQQQNQEKQMAKAEAERILDVLKNSEKDVQKKLRARQAVRVKVDKDW